MLMNQEVQETEMIEVEEMTEEEVETEATEIEEATEMAALRMETSNVYL